MSLQALIRVRKVLVDQKHIVDVYDEVRVSAAEHRFQSDLLEIARSHLAELPDGKAIKHVRFTGQEDNIKKWKEEVQKVTGRTIGEIEVHQPETIRRHYFSVQLSNLEFAYLEKMRRSSAVFYYYTMSEELDFDFDKLVARIRQATYSCFGGKTLFLYDLCATYGDEYKPTFDQLIAKHGADSGITQEQVLVEFLKGDNEQ